MPVTIPNTFTPSTLADATEVNANFTAVKNALDGLRPTLFWYITPTVATGTNQTVEYTVENGNLTIDSVDLRIKTAPTGQALIVDINKNGSTIFSNRPQIDDGSTTGGSGAVFDSVDVAEGDVFTVDIDQVGSGDAGEDLSIALIFKL